MKHSDEVRTARIKVFLVTIFILSFFVILLNIFSTVNKRSAKNLKKVNNQNDKVKIAKKIEPPKSPTPKKIVQTFDWKTTRYGKLKELKNVYYPRGGILVDLNSNKILWAYNVHKKVQVASMSKMLTILLVLEEIKRNPYISLQSKVKASRKSANIRVGAVGLIAYREYILEDLLKAAAIRSANDAANQVGEFIAKGNYAEFIKLMNKRAKELGMKNSHFINPHGLPEGKYDNISTAYDMFLVANEIIKKSDYMRWSKTRVATIFNGKKKVYNTNKLILTRKTKGVDGLKTGYTRRAGSCLAFSVKRNNRRLVGIVAGVTGSVNRDNFVEKLINWGYTQRAN